MRARFLSAWNGVATIIFFASIFLDLDIFGFSGWQVGIFMWIIGGYLTNIIFGPVKKDPRTDFSSSRRRRTGSRTDVNLNSTSSKIDEFCIACGYKISDGEVYCSNCGTAVSNFIST